MVYPTTNNLPGNLLARLLLCVKFRDVTSGFRVYRLNALESINLSKIRSSGYAFQVETLYNCPTSGYEITETSIIFRERVKDHSKLSIQAILEFIKIVIKLFSISVLGKGRNY